MKTNALLLNITEFLNNLKRLLLKLNDLFLLIVSTITFLIIIYDIGFDIGINLKTALQGFYSFSLVSVFIGITTRFLLNLRTQKRSIFLVRLFSILFLSLLLIVRLIAPVWFRNNETLLFILNHNIFIYLILSTIFIVEISKTSLHLFTQNINPALLFLSSFLFLILAGAGSLLLPNSTTSGISFIDALFTSTSAVCVTGLTAIDTATQFTMMGKTYILILIQLGGLGVMTFTSFFGLFFMGSASFKSNLYLKDFINSENLSDIFKSLVKIILITFSIEIIGAIFIFHSLDKTLFPNIIDNIGFSIFHSVSAFCNAGFSTLSQNLFDIRVRFSYNIHLTVAFLIILGGIGFPIIFNYYKLIKHFINNELQKILYGKKYYHIPYIINVNSRLVLYSTFVLLIAGTGMFFVSEYNSTLKDLSLYGKIVTSFFLSVTPRTAGFNTVDMAILTPSTILITIFLMWIGASPGSTGGGIKTSSFAIALLNIYNIARGKDRIEIFRREVAQDSVNKAFAVILLSLLVIGIAILLVNIFDPAKSLLAIAFECFSAFGTVGLSLNLTPTLSEASKYVLVVTMFLGRVGTLTLIAAFMKKVASLSYKYPEENIIIG